MAESHPCAPSPSAEARKLASKRIASMATPDNIMRNNRNSSSRASNDQAAHQQQLREEGGSRAHPSGTLSKRSSQDALRRESRARSGPGWREHRRRRHLQSIGSYQLTENLLKEENRKELREGGGQGGG